MDSDSRIDAAYARKEFGDKKPSLVDYMLWTAKFETWYRVPLRCDYRCYIIIKPGGEGKVVDSLDIM
jgi:hypothetical protein